VTSRSQGLSQRTEGETLGNWYRMIIVCPLFTCSVSHRLAWITSWLSFYVFEYRVLWVFCITGKKCREIYIIFRSIPQALPHAIPQCHSQCHSAFYIHRGILGPLPIGRCRTFSVSSRRFSIISEHPKQGVPHSIEYK
jgi:hypothetical protein